MLVVIIVAVVVEVVVILVEEGDLNNYIYFYSFLCFIYIFTFHCKTQELFRKKKTKKNTLKMITCHILIEILLRF